MCVCDECGETFEKYFLTKHKKIYQERVKVQCKTCGVLLQDKKTLRNHELIHNGGDERGDVFLCS